MSLTPPVGKKQIFIAMIISIVAIITVIAIIKMNDSAPAVTEGDYESYRKRAEYYTGLKKNNYQILEKNYRLAEADYLTAINLLEKTNPKNNEERIDKNYTLYHYHNFLNSIYLALEEYDNTILTLNRALSYLQDEDMQELESTKYFKMTAYGSLASIYAYKHDYKQALIFHEKAIHADSMFKHYAYISRAELRAKLLDWQGAENDYAQAVKLAPDDIIITASRGLHLYYNREDYQAALADCNKALELKPLESEESLNFTLKNIYLLCINTNKKLGLEKEAMAHIKDATALGFIDDKTFSKNNKLEQK